MNFSTIESMVHCECDVVETGAPESSRTSSPIPVSVAASSEPPHPVTSSLRSTFPTHTLVPTPDPGAMSSRLHPFGGRISRHLGVKESPEDPYLSYYDVRLTREDVEMIEARDGWLTDNAISFWEEFLEHERLVDYPKAKIVLLRPSMAFLLTQSPNVQDLRSALPDFTGTTHIFLPTNDCRNPEQAEGGSHWSLLLVSILDSCAFHYDSMYPHNAQVASHLTEKFSYLLNRRLQFVNLRSSPQQTNGNDCGVYVCLLMQHLLLSKLLKAHAHDKVDMSLAGKEVDAKGGRKEMVRLIEERRKEGQRRRSTSHARSKSPFSRKEVSPPRIGEENSPDRRRDHN